MRCAGFFLGVLLLCRAGAEGEDVLWLRSGARLRGEIRAVGDGAVRMRPRWAEEETAVPLGQVDSLVVGRGAGVSAERAEHRVWFGNGDRLRGTVTGRDAENFGLRIAEGAELTVRKDQVVRVEAEPAAEAVLWEDGGRLADWEVQPAGAGPETMLEFGGGFVFASGPGVMLSRALPELPERFVLEYALRPVADPFAVRVVAFSEGAFVRGPGGANFMHQNSQVHAQVFQEDGGAVTWREALEVPEGSWQRVQVFVDAVRGREWFFLNGREVAAWDLARTEALRGTGRWLGFQVQHSRLGVQVAEVRLLRWDGTFPLRETERFGTETSALRLQANRADEAEVRLRPGGDVLTLRVLELTEEALVARGDGFEGEVRIPRGRVEAVRFPWRDAAGGRLPGGLSIDLDTPILLQNLREGGKP